MIIYGKNTVLEALKNGRYIVKNVKKIDYL